MTDVKNNATPTSTTGSGAPDPSVRHPLTVESNGPLLLQDVHFLEHDFGSCTTLGGGLALLFGLKAQWVAVVLALFTVGSALIAHLNISDPVQLINYTKDLATAGGLLLFVKYGAGRPSIDDKSVAKMDKEKVQAEMCGSVTA